jgi:hypothetical protein
LHSGFHEIEALAWVYTHTGGQPIKPDAGSSPVTRVALHQNTPNPFNPSTRIGFDLPHATAVDLSVFDVTGRRTITLVKAQVPAGRHQVAWDGKNEAGQQVASGVYFLVLHTDAGRERRRMLLLK